MTTHSPRLVKLLTCVAATALTFVALASLVLGSSSVDAQRRRRPRNIPLDGTPVEWTLFVSPHGSAGAQRTTITADAGAIAIADTTYQCRYGAPNRVAISTENWSETRSLECQVGTTIVSTSGFCQVSGASWGPRAAVLYLSEVGDTERIQVSIDCAVRPPE